MSEWINHVKEYQRKHGLTYKEALQQASQSYSGGSLKSNYIRNIIYKNNFDVSKMKKPSNYIVKKFKAPKKEEKIIKKEPINENDYIIDNWEDPYIGNLIYNTKIGQNISNLIERKNNKDEYVLDVFLLSFTKPINDQIIKKYGVESLFHGINKIASYMDADKFEIKFGKDKSLPIGKYLSKKSLKEVIAVNQEKISLLKGGNIPRRINFKLN